MDDFQGLWFECEDFETETSKEQCSCERECSQYLKPFTVYNAEQIKKFKDGGLLNDDMEIRLLRKQHAAYLTKGLSQLSSGFVTLDSSRPWIIYWITHALNLLDAEPYDIYPRIINSLNHMQDENGGFCGGPQQMAHCAPTYASVLALCTIGTKEAFDIIDREKLYRFFLSLKHPSGGFMMHVDGEVDCRGTYTVLSVARILNLLTSELVSGCAEFLISCQSFEGGFAGEPGNEAHGGYNFCAVAALIILKQTGLIDVCGLSRWLALRQTRLEGGFMGRTNKLVDACYSFWQGGAVALVEIIKSGGNDLSDMTSYLLSKNNNKISEVNEISEVSRVNEEVSGNKKEIEVSELRFCEVCEVSEVSEDRNRSLLIDQRALQKYILHCGQNLEGGMRDKPGKSRDFYHSCYALSGLSIAQWSNIPGNNFLSPKVYGDQGNLLKPTSAVYNIGLDRLNNAINYFKSKPISC